MLQGHNGGCKKKCIFVMPTLPVLCLKFIELNQLKKLKVGITATASVTGGLKHHCWMLVEIFTWELVLYCAETG